MAIAQLYSGSFTASTIELSFASGTSTLQTLTTPGIYQLFLDVNTVVNGDEFEVRIYEKVRSASTKRVVEVFYITDAQGADGANWVSPSMVLMNGWDMTIKRTLGVDRVIEYSVRQVA